MAESTIASTRLLNCALCKKYEGHLQSLKNFNTAWITGSTNQKVSSILDNEGSGVHKAALARKRAEAARARGESVMQSRQSDALCQRLIFPREQGWDEYLTCAL